jgi:two-component system chemotaxis response regulator CheB
VIGVVLTGGRADGVTGLAEIKRRGGVAAVQDPSDAVFPEMPLAALEFVKVDHITPAKRLASLLVSLADTDRNYETEVNEPVEKKLVELNCPECGGPVWEQRQGGIVEYRCRVGHAYSPGALKSALEDNIEASLWASIVALENAADTTESLSSELGPKAVEDVRRKRQDANILRDMLNDFSLPKPASGECGGTGGKLVEPER